MTEQLSVYFDVLCTPARIDDQSIFVSERATDDKNTWTPFLDSRATIDQQPLFEVFERKSWHLLNREAIELSDHDHRVAANDYIAEQLGLSDLRMCA
jgi:hypothetical protein